MLANIIGVLVISVIFYYVGKILYKKINPDSDCGSCGTCDRSCPFSGGNYNLELDEKNNTKKDNNKDSTDTKNEEDK